MIAQILLLLATGYSAFSQDPSSCCAKGYQRAANVLVHNNNCETDSDVSSGFDGFQKIMCIGFFKECCKSAAKIQYCTMGERLALANHLCIESNNIGGSYKKTCCECCKKGRAQGLSGGVCEAQNEDDLCAEVFASCCKQAKESKPTGLPKKTCIDITCSNSNSQGCSNTVNGPLCTCKAGYENAADGTCKDINECDKGTHRCPKRSFCLNEQGNYRCLQNCPYPNYQVTRAGVCEDVNECEKKIDICQENFECVNSVGTYQCKRVRCDQGYELVNDYCEDIDECQQNPTICGEKGVCRNGYGRYYCDCQQGYSVNSTTGKCEDIDECQINNGYCNHQCVNTQGSYKCICPAGYEARERYCYDIDECSQANTCAKNMFCFNTFGSYACINQSCPNSFFMQTPGKLNEPASCQKSDCRGNPECNKIALQSVKRVTYRFYKDVDYKGFIFNYWTSFDEQHFRMNTYFAKGNEDQIFYIEYVTPSQLRIINQKSITGPKNIYLVMQTDVKTKSGVLQWQYQYHFHVYVAAYNFA